MARVPLHPEIAPHAQGKLAVGDGHRVYWESCGNPEGRAAVVLHGGPGSGCTARMRRLLDPRHHRIVLFDQRGCGRSEPHAGNPRADLAANTTQHLIADVEHLRNHLGIDRWLVLGGSWGATLALAYAQSHRAAVSEMILYSVVTTTPREVAWVTCDAGRFFPEEWARFRAFLPDGEQGDLVGAYNRRLLDPNPEVHEPAAAEWCRWEDTHVRTHRHDPPDPRYDDPRFRLCFARLVTHFWRHHAWLQDGALLREIGLLADVPAVLIHGRRDLSSPPDIPFELARRWPASELVVIDDEGHHGGDAMTSAIVAAARRFAGTRS